ncbi:AAA family ATPase [archaeon]|jgi:circadian clock protein KaiC|nr:AAA family ATPase [archaeon]MBT4647769.1 AAA family ATPase [archaeon]MBT6821630.1 AAA family ATPase [archaeon]MBT7391842.1 AAA family ATPase [archaeon]
MIKRINTGIKKLDSMIEGGFPDDSVIGLIGPAGVGKSLFAIHYVLAGAKNGEKSVYINLEEPRTNIDKVMQTMNFGKEYTTFEKKNKIKTYCFDYNDFETVAYKIFKTIKEDKKIKRIVIDSFNGFFSYYKSSQISDEEKKSARKILSNAFSLFKREGLSILLVLEKNDFVKEINSLLTFKIDGLVELDYISLGSIERRIFIPKMRWTKQYDTSLMFNISKKGIKILNDE